MTDVMSNTQLRDYVTRRYCDEAETALSTIDRWLARGDGVAVYENHDLGHADHGSCMIVSFGSPAAQIEAPVPPHVLPDTPREVNWRYCLVATCGRTTA